MTANRVRGLFITGTDTGVGKTHVAAMIARALRESGRRVGVYKPAESGCRFEDGVLIAEDAVALWKAAGRPGSLDRVCPQCFQAPLAPHLAARAEGRELDVDLLRHGIEFWQADSDVILVEGAGGLMCPLSDDQYMAHLARDFGFPLIVVSVNRLGTINHTLQTLIAAAAFGDGLPVAGIVLNQPQPASDDPSTVGNRRELARHCECPILAEVGWGESRFGDDVDWLGLSR